MSDVNRVRAVEEWYSGGAEAAGRKSRVLNPFSMVYDREKTGNAAFSLRRPMTREIVVIAAMAAIAVAGRAAFFMTPTFKPVCAVVIIAAVSFGAVPGCIVGVLSMLASNIIFGQGPWTIFQMTAMGLVGLIAGLLCRARIMPRRRVFFCAVGFMLTVFVYGAFMNVSVIFMGSYALDLKSVIMLVISGVPVDVTHGLATFVFLWIGAEPLIYEACRLRRKHGIFALRNCS
ncbi:MAG: ECF transporter S component [Eubacterium sp.]|nr:ECF transporter S component [Eubacterium sp.]